jgi:hypothetical protein
MGRGAHLTSKRKADGECVGVKDVVEQHVVNETDAELEEQDGDS